MVFDLLPNILPKNYKEGALEIYEQIYFEHLEAGRIVEALNVLRDDIGQLTDGHEHLQRLSVLLMSGGGLEVRQKASWPGAEEGRKELFRKLQEIADPTVLPPLNRLARLLEQAAAYENDKCIFHMPGSNDLISLLKDHRCAAQGKVSADLVFKEDVLHSDEIWQVCFSPDGTMLAIGSNDGSISLWGCADWKLLHRLEGHSDSITDLAFRPDGMQLISGSLDGSMTEWDLESGKVVDEHEIGSVICVGWIYCKGQYENVAYTEDGELWMSSDVALAKKRMFGFVIKDSFIYCLEENCLGKYEIVDDHLADVWKMTMPPGESINISQDGSILAYDTHDSVHLIRASNGITIQVLHHCKLPSQHVFKSTFIGPSGALIGRGLLDGTIRIWNRHSGAVVCGLNVGDKPVSCLDWCPSLGLVAAGSDDGCVSVFSITIT